MNTNTPQGAVDANATTPTNTDSASAEAALRASAQAAKAAEGSNIPSGGEGATKAAQTATGGQVGVDAYNAVVRRVAALEAVVKAHQIDTTSLTPESIAAIPVHDGVAGEYKYSAPKVATTQKPTAKLGATGTSALTLEQIKAMPESEINQRWPEVNAFLKANPNAAGQI